MTKNDLFAKTRRHLENIADEARRNDSGRYQPWAVVAVNARLALEALSRAQQASGEGEGKGESCTLCVGTGSVALAADLTRVLPCPDCAGSGTARAVPRAVVGGR